MSNTGNEWGNPEDVYDGNSEAFDLLVDLESGTSVLIHHKTGRSASRQRVFNNTQGYSMWFDNGR